MRIASVGLHVVSSNVGSRNYCCSASQVDTRTGVKEVTFYKWKYRHYFEVVDEGDKNLIARCTLYFAGAKLLSCARNTTFNLDMVYKTTNFVSILPETVKHKKSLEECK